MKDRSKRYFIDSGGGSPYTIDSELFNKIYPIGSIYFSMSNTDPSSLFGGTWEQIKGRMVVGVDPNDSDFSTSGKIGGEKYHTLTVTEMPTHTHIQNSHNHGQSSHNHAQNSHNHTHSYGTNNNDTFGIHGGGSKGGWGVNVDTSLNNKLANQHNLNATTAINVATTAANIATTAVNQNTGGSVAHNNMPPYITVYMWRRLS